MQCFKEGIQRHFNQHLWPWQSPKLPEVNLLTAISRTERAEATWLDRRRRRVSVRATLRGRHSEALSPLSEGQQMFDKHRATVFSCFTPQCSENETKSMPFFNQTETWTLSFSVSWVLTRSVVAAALLADVFEQQGHVSQDAAAVLYEEAHELTHLQNKKQQQNKQHRLIRSHQSRFSIFFLFTPLQLLTVRCSLFYRRFLKDSCCLLFQLFNQFLREAAKVQ